MYAKVSSLNVLYAKGYTTRTQISIGGVQDQNTIIVTLTTLIEHSPETQVFAHTGGPEAGSVY